MSLAVKRGRFTQEISTNCASFPQARVWKTRGFGDPQRLGGPKANICPPAGGYAPAFFSILAQESFPGQGLIFRSDCTFCLQRLEYLHAIHDPQHPAVSGCRTSRLCPRARQEPERGGNSGFGSRSRPKPGTAPPQRTRGHSGQLARRSGFRQRTCIARHRG